MRKNLSSDERGIAHVLYIVLAVVVIGVIGFVGWTVTKKKSTSGTVNSSTSSSSGASSKTTASVYDTCLAQYHDSNLCNFEKESAANPIDKLAYKTTLTNTQGGVTSTIVYEQDGKGNTSLNMSGGADNAQVNTVEFNGTLYMQNGSVWVKYPSGSTPPTQTSNPSSNLSFMSSIVSTKFTKLGTEACGDLTCYKYKMSDSLSPTATQYVWFDNKEYKLREYTSIDLSNGTTDMKLDYQAVSISAPSPVEDLSAATQ